MNYQFFDLLYSKHKYDEIKVIGKDTMYDGKWYHMIGLTLKDKKATLYVFEFDTNAINADDEMKEEVFEKKTPRDSMKNSMKYERDNSLFLHTREFRCNGETYETAGGTSGALRNNEHCEAYIICMLMRQAGWKIEESSIFYDAGWDVLAFTEIELRNAYEVLPDWNNNLTAFFDVIPQTEAVEMPVVLELGKENVVDFILADGSKAKCYINKVYLIDMWADNEKRFSDPEYREKMLQHMTEDELENMKMQVAQTLAETCPQGKKYMAVEYECDKDISINFYSKEYLDTIPEPKNGSASALLVSVRPDIEVGSHGHKMRGCVIQTPLDADTQKLEVELFSYMERVKRLEIQLY